MHSLSRKVFRYCTIAACSVIVANGCMFPRNSASSTPIEPGTVVPGQYCAGDTLTASYNLLTRAPDGMCTDRPGATGECATTPPHVTIASTPELFTPTTRETYQNSVSFTASGDRIDVNFAFSDPTVFIPPSTFVRVLNHTETATRITTPVSSSLPHGGSCSGLTANYAPVEVPRLPLYSPNVVLQQVVNLNSFPVLYRIEGTASGDFFEAVANPGDRIDTTMPGVPASIRNARMIQAIPMVARMCTPGTGGVDPPPVAPPLNTQVITGCP